VTALGRLWDRMRSLLGRQGPDVDFDAELASHLNLQMERLIQQGLTPEEARCAARREFGNVTLLREERRQMQAVSVFDAIRRDFRYTGRTLRRNPAFAAAIVLTLALGIGANTAIFSVYDAVLLKPLPYTDPDRIVTIQEQPKGREPGSVAPANFVDWRTQSQSFSEMAAMEFPNLVLTGKGEPVRLTGAAVTSSFFRLLGARMTMGRNFLAEEDAPGKDRVAVLSYALWQDRFGRTPDILHRTIILNDLSYTVIGVLAPDFELVTSHSTEQPDAWIPLALNMEKLQRGTHPLRVFGKIRPGISFEQAQADLNVIAINLARQYPADNKDKKIIAIPLAEQVTKRVRVALTALLFGVGLLLLIACANVASLMLSRAAARHKEIAVRLALGASRRRVGQQLMTESVFLGLLGGLAGLLLSWAAIRLFSRYLPADLPRISHLGVDGRLLAFTAIVSVLTGVLFGLAPLFQSRRGTAHEALKQDLRSGGGSRSLLRDMLVVGQMAIALVMLNGAALTTQSFRKLLEVSPGFRTDQIFTARVSLPASRYSNVQRIAAFQSELLDRVRRLPGIQSAALTAYLPLSGADNAWAVTIEGLTLPVGVYNMMKYRPVSAGYFETMGIPAMRGRTFNAGDNGNAPLVVVISESMARMFWPGENPVGRRIRFGSPKMRTIVGVVGNVHHESLDTATATEMYVPFAQIPNTERQPTVVMRTSLAAASAESALRGAVSAIDKDLALDRIATMGQLVSGSVGQPRFHTILLVAFSILALGLASIGIYGVMNYRISQRTREFGIRVAVGATEGDVLRMVLRQAAILIAMGLGCGLIGSVLLTRTITGLLYGVDGWSPVVFAAVGVLLSAAALAASYLPAQRATGADPLLALRYE
jgi:putative ABC transport system permease protein